MESTTSEATTTQTVYKPTDAQQEIISKFFSPETTLIDPLFSSTNILLQKTEAERRAELVSDIEYTFSLAIKKGDNYLG